MHASHQLCVHSFNHAFILSCIQVHAIHVTNQMRCSECHQCENKGSMTRQSEESAQALLYITILRVFVRYVYTARAHPGLVCSQETNTYIIANVSCPLHPMALIHRMQRCQCGCSPPHGQLADKLKRSSLPHGSTHLCNLGFQSIVR